MAAPKVGEVIPYTYLWWRERRAGEDSGRKVRPCVVVVAVHRQDNSARIAVAPITHAPPSDTPVVEVPKGVKLHLRLDDARSWVVCDEINQFEWPGFDLGRTRQGGESYGRIPKSLLDRIRKSLVQAHASGALKVTDRD